MKVVRIATLFLTATAFAGSPAAAQSAQVAQPRGFVRAIGGITFVSETGGLLAGGVGVSLNGHLAIVGEGGRLSNVLPKRLQSDLDSAAVTLGSQFGRPLVIDGKARGVYGLVGLQLRAHIKKNVTPFVEAMAGRAKGTSVINASASGTDVSSGVEKALGMPRSETHAMFTAGAGLTIAAGSRVGFEFGYRYSRINTDDPRINTGAFHGAIRLGF